MRLPGAVSRLAAPFFGSQAEPSSRRRLCGRVVWWYLLAFGEHLSCWCVVAFSCVWCHLELRAFAWAHSPLHSGIIAGAELHLFLHSLFYVAELF
jgi:hypothetical protein